jgi:SHAQKYF class myb-like DNA-binding protein
MSHSDDGLYGRAYDSEPGAADDEEPRHTQFLDLTNGEGGERYGGPEMAEEDVINGVLSEQHYYDEDAAAIVDYDHPSPPDTPSLPRPSATAGGPPRRADGTPGSRVVENGQEHTGRWTREEHDAFLHALKQYGKEWKKVAAKVKTRTVVQTRTHAQKYFQKLQKANQPGGDSDGGDKIDMGLVSEVKKQTSQKKKRSQQQRSTASAAHLLTHLPSIPSQGYSAGPSSSAYPTHGFSAAAALSDLPPPPSYPPLNTTTSSPAGLGSYYNTSSAPPNTWGGPPSMSIVAPDPELSMRRGFPEPSPAASGKRKIAELAAAQMLAGVAATASTPMKQEPSMYDGDVTPPPHDAGPIIPPRRVGMGLTLQIVNPENLGITYDETRKRSRTGAPSPTTPWDGQLEQLVRYVLGGFIADAE